MTPSLMASLFLASGLVLAATDPQDAAGSSDPSLFTRMKGGRSKNRRVELVAQ